MPSSARKRVLANRMVFAVDQNRIVHRLDQALKQLLAVEQSRAALLEIFEQLD